MQYISLVTFMIMCLMGTLRTGWAFAFLVLFFALEVTVQASADIFRSNSALANFLVTGVVFVALLRESASQFRPFLGYFNTTMKLTCVLFGWSIVTVAWSPALSIEPQEGFNLISEGWPYFILIVLWMPMLIGSVGDWQRSLNVVLLIGVVVVVSVLVNPEFTVKSGRIGISLGGKGRTSPLAIGQMGGTLAIIGALYVPQFVSNKVSLALRIGAFVMGFLLALYSGSRGQVLFAGIVIAVCLPLSKKIRDVRTFASTLALLGFLGVTAYFVFDFVVGGMDFNRWDSKYVDGATDVRAASVSKLLIVFATTPSAWLTGLGFNAFSSVCSELSMPYSHSTFADILAELGLPAFIVLIAMLMRTYRAGKALMIRYGDSPSDRSAIATLLALVIYQVLLVNKEGHLWASVNLFMFMIVVDRLECRSRELEEVGINPQAIDTMVPQELPSKNQ